MSKSCNWSVTYNNPKCSLDEFYNTVVGMEKVRWASMQLEKGKGGTPHIQAGIGFTN